MSERLCSAEAVSIGEAIESGGHLARGRSEGDSYIPEREGSFGRCVSQRSAYSILQSMRN